MGQMYINYIKEFLEKVAQTRQIIAEQWDYPIYKLNDGTLVCEPLPEVSGFYYVTGPKKGLPYIGVHHTDKDGLEIYEDTPMKPANKKTLEGLSNVHYPVNGVTPVEGRDGRRYVLEAEEGNPFGLKEGDVVPDDWRSISIW